MDNAVDDFRRKVEMQMVEALDRLIGLNLSDYKCSICGTTKLKLWRIYSSLNPQLLCTYHAGCDQGYTFQWDYLYPGFDQIGVYVPAIPDGKGVYWGYTSAPASAYAWWRSLPTYEHDIDTDAAPRSAGGDDKPLSDGGE